MKKPSSKVRYFTKIAEIFSTAKKHILLKIFLYLVQIFAREVA